MIQWPKHIGICDLNEEGHIINLLYSSGIRLKKQYPVEHRMWYNINTVTSKYFVFYRHETCSSWVCDFMWSVSWYHKFLHFCHMSWWNVGFRRSWLFYLHLLRLALYMRCSPLACGLPLYVCRYRNSNCTGKGEVPNKHHAMKAFEGVEVYVHVL